MSDFQPDAFGGPMAHEMTDEEFEPYMEKARELSLFFREIGPKYDLENTFAYPTIKRFKESGLGALPVPKDISELSKGDSAISLAYNMHFIMVGMSMGLMSETQNKYWLGRVVDG